jgi:hypothetical protein
VSALPLSAYRNPLDLLRRFVPTPHKSTMQLASVKVTVETNDPSLVASRLLPNSSLSSPACQWKLVRDVDTCSEPAEVSVVAAGDLRVYTMGPACLIAADRESKQILAFIGMSVDAPLFEEFIFPLLCRLNDFVTKGPEPAEAVADNEFAVGERCNG